METSIQSFKESTHNNFEFSEFQNKACETIVNKDHVLVTAHTGSGKTLPAEFAIYYYVTILKKRVVYTSPIKALSNQKYKEFKEKFPTMEVGILTGDIKHNPEADVLIMTTEILQNNCFKQKNRGLYLDFQMNMEEDLGCVVFDEVHYIDDMDRGTIWEQTMMMLPNHVPYVMLSATIGQKEVFASWVQSMTHKPVIICHHHERVVPLTFYEYFTLPRKYVDNIQDKTKKKMFLEKTSQTLRVVKTPQQYHYPILNQSKKCVHELHKDRYKVPQKFVLNECLRELRDKDMFPSLLFVFSRKQVEYLAQQITTPLYLEGEKDSPIEPYFRQTMVRTFPNWREYVGLPEYTLYVNLLEKGIGVHHAGMLPVFREIMEILYEKKYIKCLVATETFAIGLNMPTRTVLFHSLYKHDGTQMRLLQSHEFTQMAGRAGRRNLDKVGHVILLNNLYDPPTESEYERLFHGSPKVLKSKFRITYHLLLNYLHEYGEEDFVSMVQTSMMNTDIVAQIKRSEEILVDLVQKHDDCANIVNSLGPDMSSFFETHASMVEKIKTAKNKERKTLGRALRQMEEQEGQKLKQKPFYDTMIEIKDKIDKETKTKAYAQGYISDQIHGLYAILGSQGFIDDTLKPTQKALNACYLHEMPCLVFSDFYEAFGKLGDYSEVQLLCLLSCFYDLKVKDDYKTHYPPLLKKELTYIEEKINTYMDSELKHNLYITCQYRLQYDLMVYMKKWYEEVHDEGQSRLFFQELKSELDVFIGDFMKCCMKIVNMCNELKIFGENDGNYVFVEKILGIQKNVQKNIVTNQSFYL
jgi:superfamily II RNA helicase